MSFQLIVLVGNLGRDPEARYTPAGVKVVTFSLATNRQWKNASGELQKETVWFRVNTWGTLGDRCAEYLHSGSQVLVQGRLIPDKETGGPRTFNRNDGSPGASFEVYAETVRFLSPKPEGEAAHGPSGESAAPADESEIPF